MSKSSDKPLASPLANLELAGNSEPRCLCALIVDCSGSMEGRPIAELNAGLSLLKDALVTDSLACLRVEVALVTFGDHVTVHVDFTAPQNFLPPTLKANGSTPLGAAIIQGLDLLEARRAVLKSAGASFYRPWLILITDGEATDDVTEAARRLKVAESQKRLAFSPIGVLTANMNKLAELGLEPPLRLDGLRFTDLFQWVSVILSSVADSRPCDQVPLPPPAWGI